MKKDSNCSELLIRYGKREVCKSKISVLLKMTITIVDLNLVPFAIPLQLKTGPVERRSLGVLVGEVVSDLCTSNRLVDQDDHLQEACPSR